MTLKMIVAYDNNYGIGKNNELLFHLKKDLKLFKQLTTNSIVVMGRKTYESLPEKNRPLPNRHNIILTRGTYNADNINVSVFNSVDQVLQFSKRTDIDVYILGGTTLYEQFINHIDTLYATEIDSTKEADSYFPFDKLEGFIEDECYTVEHEENNIKFKFKKYIKNK